MKLLQPFFTLLILMLTLSGCGSVSYYAHVINGHYALTEGEEDIEHILSEKKYDDKVRARLSRALEIRRFASTELGLPDNDSYKTFVKLDRPYPIWNVIAAEKFSVKARQWCFLIVGCLSYRGYFNLQDAEAKANEMAAEGFDVAVSPAAAYSTLGWFDDPLLSSMLYKEEAHLAGIIFHELAHQKVYIDDDSSFNEAFATAVELEGIRRWMAAHGNAQGNQGYRQYKARQREFNALLRVTRQQLKALYRSKKDAKVMMADKQTIIANMKSEYQKLKKGWDGYDGYDRWMQRDINNAHLALVATYHELVPSFETILAQQNYDLPGFYAEVERVGGLARMDRKKLLDGLGRKDVVLEFESK